ncbi:uncharacterized protein EDB91DRAFT_1086205 [Suillus paluster]|uniref:uncharacterized protein n=1 Tax=Suillus paluster TaxID=48578 RepID=UPI001B876480|nr:uncharacterized protein EDB91DRAFT_1086205 [Suillus paluster]KAG1728034.1 hypothetical protein EDB91DRAFT_1086205 [Suillus paluster]
MSGFHAVGVTWYQSLELYSKKLHLLERKWTVCLWNHDLRELLWAVFIVFKLLKTMHSIFYHSKEKHISWTAVSHASAHSKASSLMASRKRQAMDLNDLCEQIKDSFCTVVITGPDATLMINPTDGTTNHAGHHGGSKSHMPIDHPPTKMGENFKYLPSNVVEFIIRKSRVIPRCLSIKSSFMTILIDKVNIDRWTRFNKVLTLDAHGDQYELPERIEQQGDQSPSHLKTMVFPDIPDASSMSTLQLSKSIRVVETCVKMWELNVFLSLLDGKDKSKGASEKTRYSYDAKLEECLCLVCELECPEGKMIPKWKWRQHKSTDKERKMRLKAEKKAQKAEQAENSSTPVAHRLQYIHSFPWMWMKHPSWTLLMWTKKPLIWMDMGMIWTKKGGKQMTGRDINSDAGASPGLNLFYRSRTISPIPLVPPLIQHSWPASPTRSDSPAPAEASEMPAFDAPDPRCPDIIHEPPPKPKDVFDAISSHWFWRVIILLVAHLHLHYHVPYQACNLVLKLLYTIFIAVGLLTVKDNTAQTLTTAFGHTGLTDTFRIDAMCIKCCRHDQTPFFDNSIDRSDPDELRIGVTLGFDGFNYQRSRSSASHSSGILSTCIANLPNHLKYWPRNLLLFGITPGPKESDRDQLQYFMQDYVTDLIHLCDHSIKVKTPLFLNGNIPPLPPDDAQLTNHVQDLKTEQAMMYDEEYCRLESDKAREEFFKTNSTQWFELARLKYFDPVRMMIIDPMHNILLGIVRTQWFDSWIKTNTLRKRTKTLGVPRELDQIHTYLDAFEMPPWEARLPEQVGYPAGGSLTSDEWKGLALVFCPIIIPLIWEEWSPKNQEQNKKDLQNWDKREKARLNRIAKGKGTKKDAEPSAKPVERMHPDDAKKFSSPHCSSQTDSWSFCE